MQNAERDRKRDVREVVAGDLCLSGDLNTIGSPVVVDCGRYESLLVGRQPTWTLGKRQYDRILAVRSL